MVPVVPAEEGASSNGPEDTDPHDGCRTAVDENQVNESNNDRRPNRDEESLPGIGYVGDIGGERVDVDHVEEVSIEGRVSILVRQAEAPEDYRLVLSYISK